MGRVIIDLKPHFLHTWAMSRQKGNLDIRRFEIPRAELSIELVEEYSALDVKKKLHGKAKSAS